MCNEQRQCTCQDGYYFNKALLGYVNNTVCTPKHMECSKGYKLENTLCTPQCQNCTNGTCVSPERCECIPGYENSDAGVCVPKCKYVCINGTCNNQQQCVCLEGYYFNNAFLDLGIKNNTLCISKNVSITFQETHSTSLEAYTHYSSQCSNCKIIAVVTGVIFLVSITVKVLICMFKTQGDYNICLPIYCFNNFFFS